MELVLAAAIGFMTACGIWLILRPRTYQVIVGLSLYSYAVNLFIFGVGGESGQATDPRRWRLGRNAGRSRSAGSCPYCDRHRFRHHCPILGSPARIAWADGQRPRRWKERSAMIVWSQHLIILPILIPLTFGAGLLFIPDRQRSIKALVSLSGTVALAGAALLLIANAGESTFEGVYFARQLGGSIRHRPRDRSPVCPHGGSNGNPRRTCANLFAGSLALRRSALPQPVPVLTNGPERRFPDRGSIQPLRVFRGDAGGILRADPITRLGNTVRVKSRKCTTLP